MPERRRRRPLQLHRDAAAHRAGGGLQGHELGVHAVKGLDQPGCQHLIRFAEGAHAPVVQRERVAAVAQRVIGMVRREQHRVALARELGDLREHPLLVAEIQICGGLVHDQQPRLLHELEQGFGRIMMI